MIKRLASIPGISSELVKSTGATDILDMIPIQYRTSALVAYNDSLRRVFQVALCMAYLALPGAIAMEWRSVKKKVPPKVPDDKQTERGNSEVHGNVSEKEASGGIAKEAEPETMTVSGTNKEKSESKDVTVMRSTVRSDAAYTATQREGRTT